MVKDRGKLAFSDIIETHTSEELSAIRTYWESFLDSETEERDRYLRALEIEFSLDSIATGDIEPQLKEEVAKIFSEKKYDEQNLDSRNHLDTIKKLLKNE